MVAEVQILLFLFKTFCDTDYLLIFFINKRHNQILPLRISLTHKHSVFKLLYDTESAFQPKQRIVSFNG